MLRVKMCNIKILVCLFIYVIKVNSMSIHGKPLTRYDPCSLGALHFDKISDKFWQGVVNFGLYTNLTSGVEFNVVFDKKVVIYGEVEKNNNTCLFAVIAWKKNKIKKASQNSTIPAMNGSQNFLFKLKNVPSRYSFFVKIEENETEVPTVKKFSVNNYTLCDDAVKASQNVESFNVSNDGKYYKHICGRRALGHAELTTVVTEAKSGDWPWHVALFVKDEKTNLSRYECGGSIVSSTAVVTAGHCVRKKGVTVDPSRIFIVAGISNHKNLNEVGRQTFVAEKVIVHPSHNDDDSTADLAVVKINKFQFTEYVQPICIWGPVYDKSNLFGYQATVVGFGSTADNKPSDVLRSTYTMVQNDTTCIDFSPKLYRGLLNEFTFCAGYGPTSAINPRNGDSGGGLVVPTMQPDHKISWFLRGVLSRCGVSPGHTECDPKYYVIYTDVGPHYGWIYHHSGLQYFSNINH